MKKIISMLAMTVLTGCTTLTGLDMAETVSQDVAEVVEAKKPPVKQYGLSFVTDATKVPGTPYTDIDLNDDSGTVSINASGPIGPVIQGYVKTIGYGLAWAEGAEKTTPVSLTMSGVSEKAAIRKLAAAAGYVAVFDHNARMVTVASQATYVFHLPRHVMQAESTTWSMNNSGSDSSSSSSGQSQSSTLGGRATFTATGQASNPAPSISAYLTSLAGQDAVVSVSPEAGHVAVRGNGVAIERVRGYLQQLANRAMRQVQIDVAVVDIGIGDESSYGVDWEKALTALSGSVEISLNTAATVNNPALTVTYTGSSISSIINVLRTQNDLKIITQPKIAATNGVPTMIFDGQELPYLGEVTTSTTDTVANQGGTVSYATDGVSLSAIADIISDSEAHLTLVPTIMAIRDWTRFDFGTAQAVAPVRSTKEALISTILRDGKTAVIGGIRYSTDTGNKRLLPFVDVATASDGTHSAREIAILLHARITPEKHQSILFSESL